MGALISQLDPGVQQFDGLSVDDDQSAGVSLSLGYDITSRFAIEGHIASLGEASLDPAGDISYQVGGISGLIYGINEPRDRARREGLAFFGRAGIGTLNSDSDLPVERLNDVHLVLGAGLEYGLANGLAGRIELVSHDTDATYAQLGLVYRFGASGLRAERPSASGDRAAQPLSDEEFSPVVTQDDSELESGSPAEADEDNPEVVASPTTREVVKPEPASTENASSERGLLIQPRQRAVGGSADAPSAADDRDDQSDINTDERADLGVSPRNAATGLLVTPKRVVDNDKDGISDASDQCPNTLQGRPVDESGCDLFDGVVEGVTFQIASNRLTDSALAVLADVAQTLKDYPDIRVSIDAHTDDRGDARSNLLLSKRRALEVTRYLVAQGIAGNRLKPNAYGETRPLDDNETSEGRRRNRRVEFRIVE